MLFAIIDGKKCEATPKLKGHCPLCQDVVFSRCGEIKVWHWAHYKEKSCDSWYESETQWHKNWKLIFGKENCEIVITKEGVRHIADVQTQENVIIELQNSPIQAQVIRKREKFYGEKMLWVINGRPFKDNFWVYSSQYEYDSNFIKTEFGIVNRTTGEIVSPVKHEVSFKWSWARQSWNSAQRPVFIDFGADTLFWVKSGLGLSNGRGIKVTKEEFVKKYGGDISLLSLILGTLI